jgi:hypothetical protein
MLDRLQFDNQRHCRHAIEDARERFLIGQTIPDGSAGLRSNSKTLSGRAVPRSWRWVSLSFNHPAVPAYFPGINPDLPAGRAPVMSKTHSFLDRAEYVGLRPRVGYIT